jgi:phosphoglycolate phosphatase
VTNKPTPFVAPLLDALDIAKYFSVIVGGGDDVQNKKPHPEPLLLVAGIILNACGAALSAIRAMIFWLPARPAVLPSVDLWLQLR